MLTEAQLTEAIGLLAHLKRIEAEFLRTRNLKNSDELFKRMDGIRWRLRNEYAVSVDIYHGKPGPDGKAVA